MNDALAPTRRFRCDIDVDVPAQAGITAATGQM
jgi:hypothetical protein